MIGAGMVVDDVHGRDRWFTVAHDVWSAAATRAAAVH